MPMREIMAEYDRIREAERAALWERVTLAYSRAPRLEDIEAAKRVALLGIGQAGRRGESLAQAQGAAKAQLAALAREQAEILTTLGLGADYLSIHFRCEACGDTGYVSEAGIKTPCACLVRRQLKEAYASSGVDEGESFESFNLSIFPSEQQRRQMRNARSICETYADTFPDSKPHTLLLMGMAGLGKTFLINCIANRVLQRSICIKVRKVTAYNLVEGILRGIRLGAAEGTEPFLSPRLLLIDDLGTEPMVNNITQEYLFSIFNERQNAGKCTVAATNLSPEDIQARYGERLFSRLFDARHSACLRLTGENLRLRP